MRTKMLLVVWSVLALFVVASRSAAQTAPGGGDDGVEVLTRGPVHEAFAEAVDANPQATPTVGKKPPEPIPELPPEQKPEGDKVEWISGYWAWDADRSDYIWVSGFWRTPPPGRVWVPGRWQEAAEGYQWVPGFWNVTEKQDVAYVPAPPAPVEEKVVPSPGEGYFYTPGVWVYRDGRYLWRAGVWVPYSEDYVWVPAHYVWTPAGYVFVEGYWDHVPHHRGMLFAPVYVSPTVVVRRDFCYVPCRIVATDFMIGCLFVRPAYHHYYFGDYYEARYGDAGYVAFVDYHYGGRWHDPLFGYYAHYPPRRDWERETRAMYVGRFHGDIARPPHTFAESERLHVGITISLGEADHHGFKMEHISHEQVMRHHEVAVARHEAAVERARVETEIHRNGPIKVGESPHVAKFDPKGQPSHTESHNVNTSTNNNTHTSGGTPPGGGTSHTSGSTPPTGGTTSGTNHTGGPTTGSGTTPPSGGSTTGTSHTGGPSTGSGTTPPGTGSSSTGPGGSQKPGGSSSKGSGSGRPPSKDSKDKDKKDHQ